MSDSSTEITETPKKTRLERFKHLYNTIVFDTQGIPYLVWMCVVTSAVLYNLWVIPLRAIFPYQTPSNQTTWMFFDYLFDTIYFIDMLFIQTRATYVSEGFTITEYKLTKQNYLSKLDFKMDVLSLTPIDLLFIYTGPDYVIFRLPRVLKYHSFLALVDLIDKLVSSPHIIRIFNTLVYMFYLIHLNACAYYAISLWEGIGSNEFVYNGHGNAYLVCFYFATNTATSIGGNPIPTQEPEYLFMACCWLMGVFVFALLIGQTRDIIATATQAETEYRKLVDETLEYMRHLNISQDFIRRTHTWFDYTWDTQRTLDENIILGFLPHKTKTDVAIDVHIKTLSKVKIFADCDEALLRELVLELNSVIYLPGDLICKKGAIGKEMYILQSGRVQVMGRTDTEILATLTEGCVFGEMSLLGIPGMDRRTANVRSQGYSNLFVLNKSDLHEALKHYPEAQQLLNNKAQELMKINEEIERKNKAMSEANNASEPEPKKSETPKASIASSNDSQALKFRSKQKNSKKSKSRYSLPVFDDRKRRSKTFETKVTVHKSFIILER